MTVLTLWRANERQRQTVSRPRRKRKRRHPENRPVGFVAARHARRKTVDLMAALAQSFGERVDRGNDTVDDRAVDFGEKPDAQVLHG